MANKTKLELTWIGKENRPKLEPRILLEDPEKSYHAPHRVSDKDIFDNMLIFGDNLLALKALEAEYTGKVKCIYIDPPFNTGQAFEYYDDGIEHSLWLGLIKDRLEILYKLLTPDGLFWMHLDDNEVHYCKVMLDEIFGRNNFVTQINYERSGSAGIGQGGVFVDTSEYILLYRKEKANLNNVEITQSLEKAVMKRYKNILEDEGKKNLVHQFEARSNGLPVKIYKHNDFKIRSISLRNYDSRIDEIKKEYTDNYRLVFRTTNPQKENSFQRELIQMMDKESLYSVEYIPSRGKYKEQLTTLYYYNAELFAWLKDSAKLIDGQVVKTNKMTNFWNHGDIPKADLANEGGVDFKRGKKPENLLKRIIGISTQKGDLVLDSFAGSGTTGAVAHKMGRRWIMVELEEHCHTHIIPRMKKVVDGEDQGGISKAINWQGGGGFRYYSLAPTLIVEDEWGNPVINKEYNSAMLAEAMCKLHGFSYSPSDEFYWMHGQSSETDFIYVTTQFMSAAMLEKISEEVGPDRSLLICCNAFNVKPDRFENLTLKKIPKSVLHKCEWGHDDYSLEIKNLPKAPQRPIEEAEETQKKKRTKQQRRAEATLFEV
ncbi:MAG: site-specific DNA-methyltransferase [Sedimentisphaerales bacterium]|nr:site-specific DNA-methyltransferase [Sedimentisphaerales bacterium]